MYNAFRSKSLVPINTHGGLLAHGAPYECPAVFSVIEAVRQLRGEASGRQVSASHALVYANGGTFSHAAVVILNRADQTIPNPITTPSRCVRLPVTRLAKVLDVEIPLILSNTNVAVVSDVSKAGGFGMLDLSLCSYEQMQIRITRCKELCRGRPWGIIISNTAEYDVVIPHVISSGCTAVILSQDTPHTVIEQCKRAGLLVGYCIDQATHATNALQNKIDFIVVRSTQTGKHTAMSPELLTLLSEVLGAVGYRVPVVVAIGKITPSNINTTSSSSDLSNDRIIAAMYVLVADAVMLDYNPTTASIAGTTIQGKSENAEQPTEQIHPQFNNNSGYGTGAGYTPVVSRGSAMAVMQQLVDEAIDCLNMPHARL